MTEIFDPIAVIGLAGRFPGAEDTGELWRNLVAGRELISFPSREDLLAAGVPASALSDSSYVRAVAEAPGLEEFDADFFGFTPREARLMDPQIRIFLETVHAAVENAGYAPERISDVGVFGSAGVSRHDRHVTTLSESRLRSSAGMLIGSLNNPDYVSTTVSYKLNFQGPSLTVMTACSSSLVAIHLACQALTAGQCELAVAGGVDIEFPAGHGYWWSPGSPFSKDGHCRPFDVLAAGTVFGMGAGVVVLRRLPDALAQGDEVRAVIRGLAVNNDGSAKVGFSAPSVQAQRSVVMEAMAVAGVTPAQVSLVEAHGTGTALGDPIELTALREAYERLSGDDQEAGSCALGSVKANIGHLGHAAGIASLIKVVLALDNEAIPPLANLTEPNPRLPLAGSPFYLPDAHRPWPRTPGRPRIAGVTSLGVGGTNVHAVLEEAPLIAPAPSDDRPRIVVWSANTAAAADAYQGKLASFLTTAGERSFAAAVSTLQHGRAARAVRSAVVCASAAETAAVLAGRDQAIARTPPGRLRRRPAVFLFPGQGSQHAGMASRTYEHDAAFARLLDECLGLFEAEGLPVGAAWRSAGSDADLADTAVAQPLVFSVGYSLAQAWRERGAEPAALLGHSIGELTAAAVAGVFDLPASVRLVAARARAMAKSPAGSMLAVAAPAESVRPLLPPGVSISALNGARQTVVAGEAGAVAGFAEVARERGLATRPMAGEYAFHTPLMATAAEEFRRLLATVSAGAPAMPVYSAATGALLTPAQAEDASFWAGQLVRPVLFADALDAALRTVPEEAEAGCVLLECGPGRTLVALARQHELVKSKVCAAVPTLPARRGQPAEERRSLLEAAAVLWAGGHDLDWAAVDGTPAGRTALPGYQFQRKPYSPGRDDVPGDDGQDREPRVIAEPGSPFSVLAWQEYQPAERAASAGGLALALLPGDRERAASLLALLRRAGAEVAAVRPGDAFAATSAGFLARPGNTGDLKDVLGTLARDGRYPGLLVHAWTLGEPGWWDGLGLDGQLEHGFYSVLGLTSQGARQAAGRLPGLLVLTERSADVSGAEPVDPARAMLHGLVRTLTLEEPRVRSRLLDLTDGADEAALIAEVADPDPPVAVALRGSRRWARTERPLTLMPGTAPALRDRGVYLITGGLGGLGRAVAKGLARTGLRPRLVLLGRRMPEPAGDWDGQPERPWDSASLLARDLEELEAFGAEVHLTACDVTDAGRLADAVSGLVARTGPVHGVFHLAGVSGGGMLAVRARADASATLAPKVQGTVALAEVFAGQPRLDFFVAFSSRAAVDGLTGGGDYAAANAFAAAFSERGFPGAASIAVDWPSWSGVGMAVRAIAALEREPVREPSREPARERVHELAEGAFAWRARLSAESYPALDEHRLGTVPVMPASGHLDLIVRAFRAAVSGAGTGPVSVTDVFFRRPLAVPAEREIEIEFRPASEAWSFSVRAAGGAGTEAHEYVSGKAAVADVGQRHQDLARLREVLTESSVPKRDGGVFTLGPRWDVMRESRSAPGDVSERLLSLTLPPAFAAEAVAYDLHPTLLDAATSSARLSSEEPHVPLIYRKVVAHAALPSSILARIRRTKALDGLITADIDVLAPDGTLLLEITGFAMRRLPPGGFTLGSEATGGEAAGNAGDDAGAQAAARAGRADSVGIPPEAGTALLLEILASASPGRRVTIRPFSGGGPVPIRDLPGAPMPGAPMGGAPMGGAAQRQPSASPPAAAGGGGQPRTVADRLGSLWQDALGFEQIAATDNFFELGGNSLLAVDLTAQIKDQFGVELGIAALFDFPTVAGLAAELGRLGAR